MVGFSPTAGLALQLGVDSDLAWRTRVRYDDYGRWRVELRVQNTTGGALTAYKPYMIVASATAGGASAGVCRPVLIACASSAASANVFRQIGLATEATADDGYTWAQVAGYCTGLVDGTTDVASGDTLKITEAAPAAVLIEDQDDNTFTQNTVAVALEEYNDTADTAKSVFMLGIPCQITA